MTKEKLSREGVEGLLVAFESVCIDMVVSRCTSVEEMGKSICLEKNIQTGLKQYPELQSQYDAIKNNYPKALATRDAKVAEAHKDD